MTASPIYATLGLSRNPFPPTPDAGSYFFTPRLEEDFAEIVHCIEARKGFVLLTGEVKDAAMKSAVEREVRAIDGVAAVVNELVTAGPSTYTQRSNDALITTKVKASLVEMKTISATSFKVITERGVVYLMGRVTQREGQIASDVARGVSGVNQVVKVLEYITDEELKTISPRPSTQL